jgi:hypothetical protein
MSVKQYDPAQVDVIFAGFPLSGFQEDSIIEVEFDDDHYEIVKGVDGDVSRSRRVAKTATVTVKLMNTSRSNADLTAVYLLGTPGSGSADVAPLLIRDRNGVSLFATDTAWVNKPPGITHGGKANARDWKLTVVNPKWIEGGV